MNRDTNSIANRLIAHRGQQRDFPENSLPGLQAAAEAGACAVEVDVQLSADQVAMLYHDENLQRISGCAGKIFDYSAAQLQTLGAHEPGRLGSRFDHIHIAALALVNNFLLQHPHITAYIEMKPHSVDRFGINNCISALQLALPDVLEHCVVISFHQAFIDQIKPLVRSGIIVGDKSQLKQPLAHHDVVFCNTRYLSEGVGLRSVDAPVAVYEVATRAQALSWLAKGAAWVESHDIAGLLSEENTEHPN